MTRALLKHKDSHGKETNGLLTDKQWLTMEEVYNHEGVNLNYGV